ncbi:Uncharacterised protein [Serratia fonticola]|uniref:Uncharacterized protein n=1 Tax=Serratia fonticola TaxID=47917 RepID=A0A4U9UMG2_SERFO|nr:Uncharacterised protein [Serratia fonticola]
MACRAFKQHGQEESQHCRHHHRYDDIEEGIEHRRMQFSIRKGAEKLANPTHSFVD